MYFIKKTYAYLFREFALAVSFTLLLPISSISQQFNNLQTIIPGQNSVIIPSNQVLLNTNKDINQINRLIIEQDIREYEVRRENAHKSLGEINKSFGKEISYKFPSRLAKPGAKYYKMAFDTIESMLKGKQKLNVKKAVFIGEWAYHQGTLSFSDFDNAIKNSTQLIRLKMQQDKLPSNSLGKNYAIFKFFSDTLKVKLPGPEKRSVTHYPIRYDFEDFYGEKDWTKGMVSKLLQYQSGQCHSMPLLYLILAEELGAAAYLANAPEHTYIKIPLTNGKYQNIELTNGHMTTDSYVLSSGYIKSEALASKIYMQSLSKKETIAQGLIDLAKGYRNKYGFDEFYLNMVQTALKDHPNNVNGIYMIASYYYWLLQYVLEQDPYILKKPKEHYPQVWEIVNIITFYNNKLINLGYEEMPKDVYADWLKSIDKEKIKSNQMINALQESVWQSKK